MLRGGRHYEPTEYFESELRSRHLTVSPEGRTLRAIENARRRSAGTDRRTTSGNLG
jgi:hypothetical protein